MRIGNLKSIFAHKIWLLAGIWLVSVCIRIPFLNRPLSIHHEWMLAHLLITLQIWDEKGIAESKYALIYTYPQDKANTHLDFIGGVKDKEGNFYYVSYPPLAFFVAYAFCKIFFLPLVPLSVQIFNLLWHFVCAYWLYKFIRLLFQSDKWALWAFVVYLFLPFNLWYHGNSYFVDIFVQGLWIGYAYFWLKIYHSPEKKQNYIFLFVLAFCMMYTEWIAVFVGISTLTASVILFVKERNPIRFVPTAVAGIAMVMALSLTLYQYANIEDFKTLQQALQNKYEFRSGKKELREPNTTLYWFMFLYHYIKAYSPIIVFILTGGLYIIFKKRKTINTAINPLSVCILILFGLPVILHHTVLFGFTYFHEFSVLKSSFILIILSVWLFRKLNTSQWITISIIILQISMYYGAFYRYTDAYKTIGEAIKKERKPDELVVLAITEDFWAVPQIMYYAQSNFYYEEKQLQDLPKFLDKHNIKKHVIFYIEKDKILSIKHVVHE